MTTPLYSNNSADDLHPPRAPYADSMQTPMGSPTPSNSAPLLPDGEKTGRGYFAGSSPTRPKGKRKLVWGLVGAAALVVVVLAVILPVYFTVIRPNQDSSSPASSNSDSADNDDGGDSEGNPGSPTGAITGGDGSTIVMEDGTEFTYTNPFRGFWVSDPEDPFNMNAQPNSWTPPLNTSWAWGQDKIYGVNLGGLFVLEPFISPAVFQRYEGAVDEWTLSEAMRADGTIDELEDHYNTFITEKDIAEIAGAGLNWVRIPIPFWAIETWEGEPFLERTCWKYILRVFEWCRKYGIRINLDLHAIPGSQNSYNHSGRLGQVNFMNGVMGVANAQRALYYIRVITEFIMQPEYRDLILIFGIVNEALVEVIGRDQITSFYMEAHDMIRGITGYGEGNGPYISIHDGFQGITSWSGFLPGSDRIAMDTHPYFAFTGNPNNEPIATGEGEEAGGQWPLQACNAWGPDFNTSQAEFGVTTSGEFSNGYNDCGLFLLGVGNSGRNAECETLWQDASTWNATVKAGVQAFAEASMDALQHFFFWTWKIGNSTAGRVETPLWSYQLGLEGGWMPKDPRTVVGKCARIGADSNPFNGEFQPWQTGGAGAGTIAVTAVAQFGEFPPATLNGVNVPASILPTYTPTGTVVTLPPATFTAAADDVSIGDGWFNDSDTAGAPATIAGCSYAPAWDASGAVAPTAACGTGAAAAATTDPAVAAATTDPAVAAATTDPAVAAATTDPAAAAATTDPAAAVTSAPLRRWGSRPLR